MNQKQRKARLRELLQRMKSGEDVANRDLKNAMPTDYYQNLKDMWQYEKERRDEFADKPNDIKKYEALLKKADFLFNRSEHYSTSNCSKIKHRKNADKTAANRLSNQAEAIYGQAAELLQEIIEADRSLESWFDRPIDFDKHGKEPCCDPDSIPRVVASRSIHNKGVGIAETNKRQLKMSALKMALEEIKTEEALAKKGISKEEHDAKRQEEMNARLKRLTDIKKI